MGKTQNLNTQIRLIKTMSFLNKLRKAESPTGLAVATLCLVPFELFLFIPVSLDTLRKLLNMENPPVALFAYTSQIFIAYLALPIIYCTIVSLLFQPKRLVSPLNIQIITFATISIYLILSETTKTPLDLAFFLAALLFFCFFGALAISVGSFQYLAVRWVIGLDFEDNLDCITYSVNADYKTMATKVLHEDFLKTWKFNRTRGIRKILLYKLHRNSGETIVLALSPDPKDESKSILATVAYQQKFSAICGWKIASNLRNDLVKVLREDLFNINFVYDLTEIDWGGLASHSAYNHAKEPACSKVGITKDFFKEVWEISHYYVYAMAITVFALIGTTLGFVFRLIDPNTYLSMLAAVFLALVAELGISLREELNRKRIEEIEDLD